MHIVRYDDDRKRLLPFFAMADDSETEIATYIALGELLVARDGNLTLGHLQILETGEPGVFELKSMAVTEHRRCEGIGRHLVKEAIDRCRARNGHRLIVATAAADTGNLRFYQRQGFRFFKIVRDAFTPGRGYPVDTTIDGIRLRDQVFLANDLSADREIVRIEGDMLVAPDLSSPGRKPGPRPILHARHDLSPNEIDAIEECLYRHNRQATGPMTAKGWPL